MRQRTYTRRGREDARGRSASVATASVPSRAETPAPQIQARAARQQSLTPDAHRHKATKRAYKTGRCGERAWGGRPVAIEVNPSGRSRIWRAEKRMPRQANAIDLWRGFALVSIFINHIPGIYYGQFTHGNYSISDSADLFVFLAGWSLRYLVNSVKNRLTWCLVLRLFSRAAQIYAAQILITMIAIAMLATAATLLENPLLLEWHNAAAVCYDPEPSQMGLAH